MSKRRSTTVTAAIITAAGAIAAAIIAGVIATHHPPNPSPTPTPTPSPTYAIGTVEAPAGDQFAYLYSVPTADLLVDRVGEASNGTNMKIMCTVQGPAVGDGDTLWDKVAYNSGSAYISDQWLYTGTNQAVMPSC
jgi:hypothetical protein